MGALTPLLLLELALRLLGPVLPGNYETGVWMAGHPVLGHFHVPNSATWLRSPEFTVHLRFNADGLRGPALAASKPTGGARVLLLGDSFVEAKQVAEERGVAVRLQALLSSSGRAVEVLNSGTSGWGPAEEYLYLRETGLRLRPDVVVVNFYLGNDISNNYPRSERERRNLRGPAFGLDANGELQDLPWTPRSPKATDRLIETLGERFVLLRVFDTGVLDKLRYRQASAEPVANPRRLAIYRTRETPALREAWRVVDELLGAIQREAERAGARTVLAIIPSKWQVHDEDWRAFLAQNNVDDDGWDLERPGRRLARIAERRNLPVLDLLPGLRAAAAERRLYYPVDIHWTADGHALAAEALADFLRSGRLIEP